MSTYDLRQLTVFGAPTQMGEQHGAALAAQIRAFIAMRFEATNEFLSALGHPSLAPLIEVARQSLQVHAEWHREGYEEHCGIARGAGVDAAELYAAANMTDMRDALAYAEQVAHGLPADAEGCSTVLLPRTWTASGQQLVAQTWDLNPQDLDYVVAIHRQPARGPASWSVTCTGCLSLVGMNSAGLAVGTTNIKTQGSRPGVGYMGILHKMLSCDNFTDAAAACTHAPRAAAHTYWLADGEHLADWETTAWSVRQRHHGDEPLLRTNHCLVEAHARCEVEAPSSSSRARLQRLRHQVVQSRGHDLASLKKLFADRSDGVDSINRLPEDGQGTATNSVVICEPASRRMWACRGPADRGHWYELAFAAR
ncbi:MAG: hypothetical protein HY902_12355 [Deltaproteobacteria bacterium]|nr:hypothetical protein [Deltaproteobacteria bacterium]